MITSDCKSPQKQYTPVIVRESPVNSRMNLTGSARQARDNAADIFNSIQSWNNSHISGMAILKKIYDLKLTAINKPEGATVNKGITYPKGLQEYCNLLEDLCSKMTQEVETLKLVSKYFESLKKLEHSKNSFDPIFLTWQMDTFVDVSKTVAEAYEKELQLKIYIKESIAHAATKEQLMFYCTVWAHQPYIDNSLEFKVEALLKETGHR